MKLEADFLAVGERLMRVRQGDEAVALVVEMHVVLVAEMLDPVNPRRPGCHSPSRSADAPCVRRPSRCASASMFQAAARPAAG